MMVIQKQAQKQRIRIRPTILNGIDHSKRRSIGIEALNRWKESAGQAMLPRNRREEGEYAED